MKRHYALNEKLEFKKNRKAISFNLDLVNKHTKDETLTLSFCIVDVLRCGAKQATISYPDNKKSFIYEIKPSDESWFPTSIATHHDRSLVIPVDSITEMRDINFWIEVARCEFKLFFVFYNNPNQELYSNLIDSAEFKKIERAFAPQLKQPH